jgi:hypothetical protein
MLVLLAPILAACGPPALTMNDMAERYVKRVLGVGQHDPDLVDAYFGDPAWRPAGDPVPLDRLLAEARELHGALQRFSPSAGAPPAPGTARAAFLDGQLTAVETRLEMLAGRRFTFDDESLRLYDARAPEHTEAEFQQALDELARELPGPGDLNARYTVFRNGYIVPRDRLDAVFRAAIAECRARTAAHLTLPAGESFTVEYVTGKSWSGYNWFKGHATSLIQVNTDLPITIDRAIDLACHEGYPGHHAYHSLLEDRMVRTNGWVEFSVYPLFSPQALISEGTANFGIDVAFPADERLAFEQRVLYPLAGLDPAAAPRFATIQRLVDRLGYAGNEAARRYLNGGIDRAGAIDSLMRWAMSPRDRAVQRTRFFDQYRSYVINYTLGRDLVRAYVERRGGTADHPDVRWREFEALLVAPHLPSSLQ